MDASIKAGVYGFLLATLIDMFSPVNLYFIPSFLAAIFAIYMFRVSTFKDGLVAAFMTYIFDNGVIGTIELAQFYFAKEPYPSFNIDVWTMVSPLVWAVTAFIAGYIGVRFAQKRKPPQESPPSPSELPPIPPV